MANPHRDRTVDVEEELFWKQIQEGYNGTASNAQLTCEIEVGSRHADIYSDTNGTVIIVIREFAPKQPELIGE